MKKRIHALNRSIKVNTEAIKSKPTPLKKVESFCGYFRNESDIGKGLRYHATPPNHRFGIATPGSYERQDHADPFLQGAQARA